MKPLVSVNDLVAYRMGKPLFYPFTLEIECGEIAVIQGANGCGKSTVLDCLCGRYADWTGKLSARPRALSYLPQQSEHPQTVPLSAIAPLAIGFDAERFRHLLNIFALESQVDRLPSLLSGGELQRTRLLLALLRNHDVLLLDEPFANVDESCREALRSELQATKSRRAAIIVSHLTDEGLTNIEGDRTVVLRQHH